MAEQGQILSHSIRVICASIRIGRGRGGERAWQWKGEGVAVEERGRGGYFSKIWKCCEILNIVVINIGYA